MPRPFLELKSLNTSSADLVRTRGITDKLTAFGIFAQEQAPLPTEDELERDTYFHVFADQVVSEERPENIKSAPVATFNSETLLVRDAVASIPVHVEEAVNKLVLETLTANKKGVNNRLSAALETLGIRTVQKVVNPPEFISRFSDDVIDNPRFITPVAALVK